MRGSLLPRYGKMETLASNAPSVLRKLDMNNMAVTAVIAVSWTYLGVKMRSIRTM